MSQRPPPSRRAPHDTDQPGPPLRPPIWVEGRQAPPFSPGAFLRVSQSLARRSLAPVLERTAKVLKVTGGRWLDGELRVDFSWLGRAAALIPSHQRTGRALLWLARLASATGQCVLKPPEPEPPPAYPNLLTPRKAPVPLRPKRPQRQIRPFVLRGPKNAANLARPVEPLLLTIRGALADNSREPKGDSVVVQFRPRVDSSPQPAPIPVSTGSAAFSRSQRLLSPVFAYLLITIFLIPGAVRAILLYLDGTDLRTWE